MGQGFLTGEYTSNELITTTITPTETPDLYVDKISENYDTEVKLKENNYPLCRFKLDGCTEEELRTLELEDTIDTTTTNWFLTKNTTSNVLDPNNTSTTPVDEPPTTTTPSTGTSNNCIVLLKVESGIRVINGKIRTSREPIDGVCVNNEIQLRHPTDPTIWEPVTGIRFEGTKADLLTNDYDGWKATVTYSYISCLDYTTPGDVTNPPNPTDPGTTPPTEVVEDTFEYIYKNIRSRPCQTDMSDKNYLIHSYALEDNKRIIITVDMRTRYKIITTISGDTGYPYSLIKTTLHDEDTFINTDYTTG